MCKRGYKQTEAHIRNRTKSLIGKELSLEHRRKIAMSNKGRSVSEETRRKISIGLQGRLLSKEHKKRISNTLMGHSFSDETLQKLTVSSIKYMHEQGGIEHLSKVMTEKQNTPEARKRLAEFCKVNNPMSSDDARNKVSRARSNWCSQAIIDGSFNNVYHKSSSSEKFYSEKNCGLLHYRSSYELQAYKLLEQMMNVEKYLVENIRIKYMSPDGRSHYTIPDLLVTFVDRLQAIIEVKPQFKMQWDNEIIKFDAIIDYAQKEGMLFFIWTEQQLFHNELIDIGTGRILVKVSPGNTSQNCSGCGEKVPKTLAVRVHACPYCGLVVDRDENAARNILQVGQTCRELTYAVA